MPRAENQKLKSLYVARMLAEQSDETHPLSAAKIISGLAAFGITAERKSIYADLAALQEFGLDIVRCRDGFFLASRDFSLPELKLLVDSVQSANFITRQKSEALIAKLEKLTSVWQAKSLHRQVLVNTRVKARNEAILYNVDTLHDAISGNRQIRFQYFDYALDKSRVYRRGGDCYTVSPFALTWDNANYYLIAYSAETHSIRHYRVDRMEHIALCPETREGTALFQALDLSRYTNQVFGMFSGETIEVKMRFDRSLVDAVLDRFGYDAMLIPDGDSAFTLRAKVAVSEQFFAWICGFGTKARVLEPQAVTDRLRAYLAAITALY